MALELGVSPHAVEKRLKMARAKLGLSSSLEAARLLVASERYQRTGPQSADLASDARNGHVRLRKLVVLGGIAMTLVAAAALVFALQAAPGGIAPLDGGGVAPLTPDKAANTSGTPEFISASASPEQVEDYLKESFARFDRDRSGFIERSEGPSRISLNCCGAPRGDGDILTGEAAWQRFRADNADDGDNRISYAEYRNGRYDKLLENGIPVRREDVVIVGERRSPYETPHPGETTMFVSADDFEHIPASPERVRAYVRQMFDRLDADRSGFLELAESPVVLITQQARLGADGKVTYDPNAPGKRLEGDAARRQYIANVDKDDDGKLSFEEYAEPVMPQYLRRGIPLIPADWTYSPPNRR